MNEPERSVLGVKNSDKAINIIAELNLETKREVVQWGIRRGGSLLNHGFGA